MCGIIFLMIIFLFKANIRKLAVLSKQKQIKISGDILERLLDSPNGENIVREFENQKPKKPKDAVQEVTDVFVGKVNEAVDIVTNVKDTKESINKETKSAACSIL